MLVKDRKSTKACKLSEVLLKVPKVELGYLLENLLTEAELDDLLQRITIITKYMSAKVSQRTLAKDMWISITTVNKWVHECKYNPEAFAILSLLTFNDEQK